jgi:enoyl-[acyl-carrier protein] reductase I
MTDPQPLMAGKCGLIMGVANDRSIAWGIARAVAAHGAELAFTYQGEALEKRVRPLAESVGSNHIVSCDVTDEASVDATFAALKESWGGIDFLVHATGIISCARWKFRAFPSPRCVDGRWRSCPMAAAS